MQGVKAAIRCLRANAAWNWDDEASYSFGYSLSYTTFEQKLNSVDVKVGEKNSASGDRDQQRFGSGKSVAQLYVQAPYIVGGLEKSAVQLVGFAKTGVLEPGASEELNNILVKKTGATDNLVMTAFNRVGVSCNGGGCLTSSGYDMSTIGAMANSRVDIERTSISRRK